MALLFAITLHNIEEFVTLGTYGPFIALGLGVLGIPLTLPPLQTMQVTLASFALFPFVILGLAARKDSPRFRFVTTMIAAMSLTNAIVPHIVLGMAVGRYVPGLFTAIALALPVGLWSLFRIRRQKWLSTSVFFSAIATGIVLLPAVLTGFWALGELIRELAG